MVLVSFWRYPDPDPYRLKRIRILPNEIDPYETLLFGAFSFECQERKELNTTVPLDKER